MSSTARDDSAIAAPALLYPTLLIAGIAVIVASLLGIAAMTGLLPAQPKSVDGRSATVTSNDAGPAAAVPGAAANVVPAKSAGDGAAAAPCGACGVVEAVRKVETGVQTSAPGGAVGGILGSEAGGGRTAVTVASMGAGANSGHETGDNMKKDQGFTYEIRVRMDDHSYRTFRAPQSGFGVGQRVKVREGRLLRAD